MTNCQVFLSKDLSPVNCIAYSVTRFGVFKFLVIHFLVKLAQIFGNFLSNLKTSLFKGKLLWLLLNQPYWAIWLLFSLTSGHTYRALDVDVITRGVKKKIDRLDQKSFAGFDLFKSLYFLVPIEVLFSCCLWWDIPEHDVINKF